MPCSFLQAMESGRRQAEERLRAREVGKLCEVILGWTGRDSSSLAEES